MLRLRALTLLYEPDWPLITAHGYSLGSETFFLASDMTLSLTPFSTWGLEVTWMSLQNLQNDIRCSADHAILTGKRQLLSLRQHQPMRPYQPVCGDLLIMRPHLACFLVCILLAYARVASATQTVDRDIAIIRGNTGGIYAATLLQSMGRSFTMIEKRDHFRGYTETYTFPGTNETVDNGVEGYAPLVDGGYSVIEQFFGAYNFTLTYIHRSEKSGGTKRYFDFRSYTELKNFTVNTSMTTYVNQVDKYPYLDSQVQIPNPIGDPFSFVWRLC